MNSKEKTVFYFLCFTFLVGAGISLYQNNQNKKNLKTIVIKQMPNDTQAAVQSDSDEIDTSDTSDLININTASNKELEALPGVGPVIAQRIVDYRQKYGGFKRKEEILKISGIGPKKFEGIKDKITIR